MAGRLLNLLQFDYPGHPVDLHPLSNAPWLARAAVIADVRKQANQWQVGLLLVNPKRPTCFIYRIIQHFNTEAKARQHAVAYERTAARDPLGNPILHHAYFHLCSN